MTRLAYIWPKRTRCPSCGHAGYRVRSGGRGRTQYRVCLHCATSYVALAIAAHIDRGGDQSEVQVL